MLALLVDTCLPGEAIAQRLFTTKKNFLQITLLTNVSLSLYYCLMHLTLGTLSAFPSHSMVNIIIIIVIGFKPLKLILLN